MQFNVLSRSTIYISLLTFLELHIADSINLTGNEMDIFEYCSLYLPIIWIFYIFFTMLFLICYFWPDYDMDQTIKQNSRQQVKVDLSRIKIKEEESYPITSHMKSTLFEANEYLVWNKRLCLDTFYLPPMVDQNVTKPRTFKSCSK